MTEFVFGLVVTVGALLVVFHFLARKNATAPAPGPTRAELLEAVVAAKQARLDEARAGLLRAATPAEISLYTMREQLAVVELANAKKMLEDVR